MATTTNGKLTHINWNGSLYEIADAELQTAVSGISKTVTDVIDIVSGLTVDKLDVSAFTAYTTATDGKIESIEGDITDINNTIDAMDFTGATGGSVITQVTQEDGKVSATTANLTSEDKTVTVDGLDLAVNIDGKTIVKDSDGKIGVASSAITVNGKDAVKVTTGASGNQVELTIDNADKVLSQTEDGLLANLELKYTPKTGSTNGKIELIGKGGVVIGTAIDTTDFTVDGFLDSVAFSTESGKENVLVFTWNTDTAGKTTTEIDLTNYIDTYLAGNGLNLDSATKTFSVKVKNNDKYLTVDGDGVASKGIDEAIAAAVNALDATVGDASVADGKHVAVQVVEEDGIITAVTVSESDIASASDLETLSGTVTGLSETVESALEGLVSDDDTIQGAIDKAVTSGLTGYATETWVNGKVYVDGTTLHLNFTGPTSSEPGN